MRRKYVQINRRNQLYDSFHMRKIFLVVMIINALLFIIYSHTLAATRSSQTRLSTDQWAVKLIPGSDPDETAQTIGAINLGQIATLSDTYLFTIPNTAALTQTTRTRVRNTQAVVWTQQQVRRWRFLRTIPYFTDPIFPDQWHLSNKGQHGGTPDEDVHVLPAWDAGISGNGIVIGIVDDGLQHTHPDLSPNYAPDLSYDFNDNDQDPTPFLGNLYATGDPHGTSVAGVAAARENNDTCGVGAAYHARLAGLRLLASEISDADEAQCLSYQRNAIHIYNNSWGPSDGGGIEGPGPLALAALIDNIEKGRNGLGNIYVFAAGNGLQASDNVNYDGYANQRFVIAVSAVDQYGYQSYYSEPGACILVCAPSEGSRVGIYTTDLTGQYGYNYSGDCTGTFGGTSSAAPLVSGIIALVLEANPNLTWRDVQHVLAKSADKNNPGDPDWTTNGAGLWVNHKYGFGRIHADHAVKLARQWQSVSPEISSSSTKMTLDQVIPDNTNQSAHSETTIQANLSVEHVAVILTTKHDCTGQLEISLTSPSGTKSILAQKHVDNSPYEEWRFTSVRHWGENSDGSWALDVYDKTYGCTGTVNQWQLIVYGESQSHTVNQTPIAISDTIHTTKNQSIDIYPLTNDLDADHDMLQLVNVSSPIHGSVVEYTNDRLTYVPDDGFTGIETLSYIISDQQSTQTGEIVIYVMDQVLQTNNTSVSIPDADLRGVISGIELHSGGRIQSIDVYIALKHDHMEDLSGYLISPDNDQLLLFSHLATTQTELDIHLMNTAANRLSQAAAPYTGIYLPENSFDTIENSYAAGLWQLMIIDDTTGQEGILKEWKIRIIFSTTGPSEPPAARSDRFYTDPNVPICMNVIANDSDPNGIALHIQSIVDNPASGAAVINPNCGITYQPDFDFTGIDSLTYMLVNEHLQTSTAQVDIVVASDLALSFDGINDHMTCGKPEALNIQDHITIELWIHPTSFGELDVQGFGRIIDREKYILFLNETGRDDYADHSLMFAIEHPNGNMVMANTPKNSIQLNQWQHLVASYDSSLNTIKMYINGQQQSLTYPFSRPSGLIANSQSDALYIGESKNMDRAFQGLMDEIRIWNIVRTETEILSNMNTGFQTIPDNLVAYWPMKSIQTYLMDMGPNHLHCQISSPQWVPGLVKSETPKIWAAQDDIFTQMNTSVSFDPSDNDGVTGEPVTLSISPDSEQTHSHGQLNVLTDCSVRYTPDEGYLGTDHFQYTITSADGKQASANILIHVVADFSLYYDHRTDYVNAGNSEKWALDGPFTLEAWIHPIDTASEKDEQLDYLMDKNVFSVMINHRHSSEYWDNSLVYWMLQNNGDWHAVSTPEYSIQWNRWQHIAVVDDANGQLQLYINGEKMKLLFNGSLYAGTRANHHIYPFILGNASDLQHGFQGWMDEIYVWSEARTQAQIQQSMFSCFPGKAPALIAYFPMNTSNTQLLDRSMNTLNGSLYGVQFQSGILPRYPVSLGALITLFGVMSGFSEASVCVEDVQHNLVLGMDDLMSVFLNVVSPAGK
ncbi:MAG: S8 family serine peptidase [Candidatus Magnetomorum sp.]|nr:S8 family serine peptidase [Candidatus Magnetomorum sp.]